MDNKVIEKVGIECVKMRDSIIQFEGYCASSAYFNKIGLSEDLRSRAMEECVRVYRR